ncbi:hypothetical protein ACFOGI_15175 [Virgibacillus xinjiangensis]|uniref:Zinc finger CHC2-type domain-containing protein n=1 Tax=Virgibacillus xinjiangensis TaxID=393090 RepID=A0ABV7CYL3_9BACI
MPSILDVAQKYGIRFETRSYGQKETRCKCPFCEEDANKPKKYYLSLNTVDNVYKCWYCKASGGVLDFEMQLSGKSYNEVKEKYFGKKKRKLHPACLLNPYQLDRIGWKEYKRKSFQDFLQKREEVIKDWKRYVHDELVVHYALFICIAHLENQEKRQEELLVWLIQSCWKSYIPNMYTRIQDEILKPWEAAADWAREGTELGRSAWRVCLKTMDFELETLLLNIMFIHYAAHMETKKRHVSKEKRVTQKVI